jgi:hypothetical protein
MKLLSRFGFAAAIIIVLLGLLMFLQSRSLRAAEQAQLLATFERWGEAGRPYGKSLEVFMEGRGRDFLVDTQRFEVSGTAYFGILARTNLVSKESGRFVVTTNRVLLYVDKNGNVSVAR